MLLNDITISVSSLFRLPLHHICLSINSTLFLRIPSTFRLTYRSTFLPSIPSPIFPQSLHTSNRRSIAFRSMCRQFAHHFQIDHRPFYRSSSHSIQPFGNLLPFRLSVRQSFHSHQKNLHPINQYMTNSFVHFIRPSKDLYTFRSHVSAEGGHAFVIPINNLAIYTSGLILFIKA